MEKRGSTYYLFYSGNDYRAAYGMGYATAGSPMGATAFPAFAKWRFNPYSRRPPGYSARWRLDDHGTQGRRLADLPRARGQLHTACTLRIDPVWFETNGWASVGGPTVGPRRLPEPGSRMPRRDCPAGAVAGRP